ncbi:hypothetical protein HZS55_16550 [Halosimplex rubrum]|uniref:Uncharacterized protein n=1 Tax=Halosimplex rubrum TaxID=869889 RepID=A0A7D5P4E0_9EURY|nr:hypothetical protein [Halosimplex rubrum]QLH78801.1 hypothetical protein HZS55_16550 [Halosimplex rubrum]
MSFDIQDEEFNAVEVTHSPAQFSSIIAVVAALLAVVTTALVAPLSAPVGLFGLAGVAAGLFVFESERLTIAGTAIVFVGVVAAGFFGDVPEFLLFAALATIVSFDLGSNAFSVGRQMSEQTDTQRGEAVHVAATVFVGVMAAGLSYGLYIVPWGSLTVPALTLLLLSALFFIWSIRQ